MCRRIRDLRSASYSTMTQSNFGVVVVVVVVVGAYAVFTSLILRIELINKEDDDNDGASSLSSEVGAVRFAVRLLLRYLLVEDL